METSYTPVETDSGLINVIHEITLGDILIFVSVLMLLILHLINIVRR
ncbi:hypothetical protein [Piscibacillus halophilus]|nr:hypothetical protein [Piscibacillus halophilus]